MTAGRDQFDAGGKPSPQTPRAINPPPNENMRRHVAIAFGLALVFYVVSFSWIQHERVVKGPWEIVFAADNSGSPSLQILQTKLKISEKLVFPEDKVARTNFSQRIIFNEPTTTNLPFGEMLLQDAVYLPGSVAIRLGGHIVEVLPRTLIVDKKEHAWQIGQEIAISKTATPE